MSTTMDKLPLKKTGFAVSALSIAISSICHAQDVPPPIEEVQVFGRLKSGAESLAVERMDQSVAVDIIGIEQISRIGDSDVASALRRVPGITLVDDKFVYVRGLGERYSSTLLNGAVVPSPDLTRSVIPLDIFPTSIVESLSVQKVYSANMPAHFGGGAVDIRTTGVPDDIVFNLELGLKQNSISRSDFLTYNGDEKWGADESRALSSNIYNAIDNYRGDISINNIQNTLQNQNSALSDQAAYAEAQRLNRDIALDIKRDNTITAKDPSQDYSFEGALGNNFDVGKGVEFGIIANTKIERESRNKNITQRKLDNPSEHVTFTKESTETTNVMGSLATGLNLNFDNKIETTHIFLRNTEDSAALVDQFGNDGNNPLSSGEGERNSEIRFEEREMRINQIRGSHELGADTLDLFGWDALRALEGLKFEWYVSNSTSTTDLPNETSINSRVFYNITNQEPKNTVFSGKTVADHRYTELEDKLDNEGFKLSYPIETPSFAITLSTGLDNWQKNREYKQLQFAIENDIAINSPLFSLDTTRFYSDKNIANNDNAFSIGTVGSNNESYIATVKNNSIFGNIDATIIDTWRVNLGIRQEAYQQVTLAWNPLAYDHSPLIQNPNAPQSEIEQYFADAVREETDTFSSLALTYITNNFWADDFQLRLSFAQTAIRPDLRELSSSAYIDPLTGFSVTGDGQLKSSYLDHIDLRAEWFFSGGDSLTVSLFSKDIEEPIEYFQTPAAGGNTALEVVNAESAKVSGIEFEFMKGLGSLHSSLDPFFTQGNITLLDHELIAGDNASSPTNEKRGLQGASDYAVNMIFGFDSPNGEHSATLAYNVFGERLFFAGRLGEPDAMEQPFNSLDLTYSYYPIEQVTIKAKIKNLLDEEKSIERDTANGSIEVFNMEIGRTLSLDVKYSF